jgi:hypothetical protein
MSKRKFNIDGAKEMLAEKPIGRLVVSPFCVGFSWRRSPSPKNRNYDEKGGERDNDNGDDEESDAADHLKAARRRG